MSLPTFDSLDAVPEPFRPFYTVKDGKAVADLVLGADVVGLKQKNAELLASLKETKEKFAGVDPDEFKALKAAGGKVQDLDSRLKVAAEAEAKAVARANALADKLRTQAKRSEVTRALADARGITALLEPVVMQMVDVEEAGDDYHVVVRNADGTIRYKDGAGNRFTVADLVADLKKRDEFKPAFLTDAPAGGGAPPNAGSGGGGRAGVRTILSTDKTEITRSVDDIRAGKAKVVQVA